MAAELAKLRQRLPWLRPWMPAAAVMAIGIVGYGASLGMKYWTASLQVDSLISQLPAIPDVGGSTGDQMEKDLELQRQRFLGALKRSSYGPTELKAIIDETAEMTEVSVPSWSTNRLDTKTIGEFEFEIQPFKLEISGAAGNIYAFLSLLGEKVPVAQR